jgi:hypothetical protein
MTPAELQERISTVGMEIDRIALLLVSPTPANLDRCAQSLEMASFKLSDLCAHLSPDDGDPALLARAKRIQRAVVRATALLDWAAQFHHGWNQILGGMCGGYRAGGVVAPIGRPARGGGQG